AGILRTALDGRGTIVTVAAGVRTGLPGGVDEAGGGDGAAAMIVGDDGDAPVVAEHLASASVNEEFLDRWRIPGERSTRRWEERFGETRYLDIGRRAWDEGLKAAGVTAEQVDVAIVTGAHARAARSLAGRLGVSNVADDLTSTVGHTGAAHPALVLSSVLERAEPGQVIALVSLADGADVLVLRATDAVSRHRPARSVAAQVAAGAPVAYGKFLAWRRMLEVEPPNRPSPARPSASAAARSTDWKFAFVGGRDRATGILHLPPSRVGIKGGGIDDMDPAPMADVSATIATYTVDRLIYSESPPVVFAVLDFEGGGRFA